MKKLLTTMLLLSSLAGHSQNTSNWHPLGDKIKTPWAESVNPNKVLDAYPRPIMTRDTWQNLNGLWDYAICEAGKLPPTKMDGQILIPYPLESSLSGVMKKLAKGQVLWYSRDVEIPSDWKNKEILLHFGAIDYIADVYVNDVLVASHQGGYSGFSANVTEQLKPGKNTLRIRVKDETDDWYQPSGKQRNNPGGPGSIWYTSVSGIWQTVWMEPVNSKHIATLRTTPDLDNNRFVVDVKTLGTTSATDKVKVTLLDNGKAVATTTTMVGIAAVLDVKKPKLWSPDSLFRYQMEVELLSGNEVQDKVGSYAAMRKISTQQD